MERIDISYRREGFIIQEPLRLGQPETFSEPSLYDRQQARIAELEARLKLMEDQRFDMLAHIRALEAAAGVEPDKVSRWPVLTSQ